MRAFSIFTAAAFALTVQCSSIHRRILQAAVQTCTDSLSSASSSMDVLIKDVGAATEANLVEQVGQYNQDFNQFMEMSLVSAQTSCCSISSGATDEDKAAVLTASQQFLKQIFLTLSAIDAQKTVLLFAGSVFSDPLRLGFTTLQSTVDATSFCLVNNVAIDKKSELQTQSQAITEVFNIVVQEFSAENVPQVSPPGNTTALW